MRLVLVRHAEATCNQLADADVMTSYDDEAGLTDQGRRQVAALAPHFAAAFPSCPLYSSPLKRAAATAAALGRALGTAVQYDERLGELRAPVFQPSISIAEWDALLAARRRSPDKEVVTGLESLRAQHRRVHGFLTELGRRAQDAIIVSHAFTIELALADLLGLELEWLHSPRFKISTSGIFVVEVDNEGVGRVVVANSKAHLGRIV
jgi:broad specificity phosphatase PhoE